MKNNYLRWTLKLAIVLTLLILALTVGKNPVYALDVGCDVTALRAAIASANETSEPDILDLTAGCVYEPTDGPYLFGGDREPGPNAFPVITSDITINGHGATFHYGGNSWDGVRFFAVNNTGMLNINKVRLWAGRSGLGGAFFNERGVLGISDSTMDNNHASSGGAIWSKGGTVNITNATFDNNHAGMGGAIGLWFGSLNISNSTFHHNHVDAGGIIFNAGSTTITHSTFANNTTYQYQESTWGLSLFNYDGTVQLRNTIFADNSAYNCKTWGASNIDEGGNLDAYASCITSPNSKSNANANLGPLTDNGGPTMTMALLPGSDALDFGLNDYCPSTDQRGIQRPQGTACDSGAYELVVLNLLVVTIDIKPGSTPNCFNNNGKGAIPVAILSSNSFDATQVDPSQVSLNGQTVKVAGKSDKFLAHTEDVNTDGLMDMVVQIADTDGTYTTGDTIATLTGKTYDGQNFQGTDSLCIVP